MAANWSSLSNLRSPFLSDRNQVPRVFPGTLQGNRKNIVIVVLESWSGKDVVVLGGRIKLTPIFDNLAREDLLFNNFYSTGIRTGEGT